MSRPLLLCAVALLLLPQAILAEDKGITEHKDITEDRGVAQDTGVLPHGAAPPPVAFPHFPSRLHTVVWRNWNLVPTARLAATLHATPPQIEAVAASLGLPANRPVSDRYQGHIYKTILRRNWHLLPYDQLLTLLDMPAEELAVLLYEDDFLWIKFGSLKPACAAVVYAPPDDAATARAAEIAATVRRHFGNALADRGEPRFAFIDDLAAPPTDTPAPTATQAAAAQTTSDDGPRFLYSYVAVFGDPLLEPEIDPFPDGLLARLAARGVNGVWLHVVLRQLAPGGEAFPEFGDDHARRLESLRALVARGKRHGIDVYLYLNEPRAMPHAFFANRPELAGVREQQLTALCTSQPQTLAWMRAALTHVFTAVPDLGGVFTITASENLTSCASHGHQADCPHCRDRSAAAMIAEVNAAIEAGVHAAQPAAKVIVWDWGWNAHGDAADHIALLPDDVWLMSVSEWDLPIERGGIQSSVGEYALSAVGPGPRAVRHWALAKARGLKTVAKIAVNNTWELSAVPWLPVPGLVAEHVHNLADANVDGLMLSWSLGGYPSPNLDIASRLDRDHAADPATVLSAVARERYGAAAAPQVVAAWTTFGKAFRQFPYHIRVLYVAPQQYGPANLLWEQPTGYAATMVGFPYDDLTGWRGPYPADVFAGQFEQVASGWQEGLEQLQAAGGTAAASPETRPEQRRALARDCGLAEAAGLHFASTAAQARFIIQRDASAAAVPDAAAQTKLLDAEIAAARRLYALTTADSRIGFEASNGCYYVPLDLIEKVICCEFLKK